MKRSLLLMILFAAFLAAQEPPVPAVQPAPPTGDLPETVVPQEIYDAGDILKGKKMEYAFKIKNAGKAELSILSAKAG